MNKNFIIIAAVVAALTLGIAIYTSRTPSQTPPAATAPQEAETANTATEPKESATSDASKATDSTTPATTNDQDKVLATFNNSTLTKSEVNEKLKAFSGQQPDGKAPSFDDLPDNAKENVVRGIVVGKLISTEAAKAGMDTDSAVQKKLSEVKDQIIQQEYITRKIKNEVTEDKVKERYNEFVKEWGDKEEIKARHILVSTEQEAKEALDELNKGTSFEEVAKKKSKDSNKDKGGDLGYFSKGQMVKPFEDAAFALKVGEVSSPVKTDFGWHVIKVEDKRKAPAPKYEDVKQRLESEVGQKIIQSYIDKLLADAKFQPSAK